MRTIRRTLVCLVLAFVITVVVAWAASLSAPLRNGVWNIRHDPPVENGRVGAWRVPPDWEVQTHATLTSMAVQYEIVTEMPWFGSKLITMRDEPNRGMSRTRTGWPFYALQYRESMDERPKPGPLAAVYLRGIELPIAKGRRIPITPVWPGLLLNTLLYGSGIAAVGAITRTAIRSHRRGRGRCPVCNYPLGMLKVCPECGYGR